MKITNRKKNMRINFFIKNRPFAFGCPNCDDLTFEGHFVPPSLGEKGFYICQPRYGGDPDHSGQFLVQP